MSRSMRKIIALWITLCMIIGNSTFIYAVDDYEYSLAKSAASQTSLWQKYMNELGEIVPKLSSEKLEWILSRIKNPDITSINSDMYDFLYFIELFIKKELASRFINEDISTISQADKMLAEKEVMKLQNTLASELENFVEQLLLGYSKVSSYEEKWDFNMNMDMNFSDSLSYSLAIELSDYISQTQFLDQTFDGDIKANFDMDIFGEEISIDGSSNASLIVKDGIYYLKMNDTIINISRALPWELTKLIKRLNSLWSDDTYIMFEDQQLQDMLRIIELLLQWEINTTLEEISSVPLFEAYSKTENGYLLRPTKEFCNIAKKASQFMFGFFDSDCSNSQYEDMLGELRDSWISLLMELWLNNTLTLEIINSSIDSQTTLKYSDYGIISLDWYILEPGNADINNISYSYIPKKTFSFSAMIEEAFETKIDMRLSRRVPVKSIDMFTRIYNSFNNEELIIQSRYANNKLHGSMEGFLEWEAITCDLDWELRKVQGSVDLECVFTSTDYYSQEQSEYNISSKWSYDVRTQKNNLHFNTSVSLKDNEVFMIYLKNIGERKKVPKREINIPAQFIPSSEIQELEDAGIIPGISSNSLYEEPYIYDDEDEIETIQHDGYSETCYTYSDGSMICDEIHNDYSKSCYYYKNSEENYCSESHDEYYYDGYSDIYYYDDYEIDWKTWEKTEYSF